METPSNSFSEELKRTALGLGFPLFGIAKAIDSPGFDRLGEWLDRGYAGTMDYLSKRRAAYRHPSSILASVKTLIMLGMPYEPAQRRFDSKPRNGTGQVAAYAQGTDDYHDLIHQRLAELSKYVSQHFPEANVRGVVDTAPLMERDFAVLAGLGWIGKNTLLLNRHSGSYFFIAALLTDIEIEYESKIETDHCGTCTACLDACPTQAFPQARVLDASRCISYLTIEHRGSIPIELREPIGDWIFGCDICQQVCPWNRMAKPTSESSLQPQADLREMELVELLSLDEPAFRLRFRKTPLWRTRRVGMLRNTLIAIGNQRMTEALPRLLPFLKNEEKIVRQTAVWAIGMIGGDEALKILQESEKVEKDADVRAEFKRALA